MQRRLLLGSLALAASAAALPAHALRLMPPDTRIGQWMQVSVVDRGTGRELPVYRHGGEYWVAGQPGARYAIRVHNRQGERLMAVMSVDGVNILSGETAGVEQTGYVFDGGQRADIAGWRKSDSQIAAFEFTSVARSYAGRTGRPDNVGVIGVAVFRERPQPVAVPVPPPAVRRERADAQPGAAEKQARAEAEAPPAPAPAAGEAAADAAMAAERKAAPTQRPGLGTGHGRRETSWVTHTEFERRSAQPDEVLRIRYDSRDNLVAAGIIPAPVPRPAPVPSPFPASPAGYVPDPPRY